MAVPPPCSQATLLMACRPGREVWAAPQGPAPSREVQVQALRATLPVISGSSSGVPPGVPDYLLSSRFCQLGIQVHGLVVSEAFAHMAVGRAGGQGRGPAAWVRKKQRSPPDTNVLVFLPPFSQTPPTPPPHARVPSAARGAAHSLHQPARGVSVPPASPGAPCQALWPACSPQVPGYLTRCWPERLPATAQRPKPIGTFCLGHICFSGTHAEGPKARRQSPITKSSAACLQGWEGWGLVSQLVSSAQPPIRPHKNLRCELEPWGGGSDRSGRRGRGAGKGVQAKRGRRAEKEALREGTSGARSQGARRQGGS